MSSNQSGEGEIRRKLIEADLVDCMVALPGQLFYSTQIPACLWFLRRDKRFLPSPTGRGAGGEGMKYADIPGFCKSAPPDEVRKHGHVLTPGRYVGAEAQVDDGEPFEEKMQRLTAPLREQQAEAAKLDAAIAVNLKELGYGG
jgi:type I restriction enzyme M protein